MEDPGLDILVCQFVGAVDFLGIADGPDNGGRNANAIIPVTGISILRQHLRYKSQVLPFHQLVQVYGNGLALAGFSLVANGHLLRLGTDIEGYVGQIRIGIKIRLGPQANIFLFLQSAGSGNGHLAATDLELHKLLVAVPQGPLDGMGLSVTELRFKGHALSGGEILDVRSGNPEHTVMLFPGLVAVPAVQDVIGVTLFVVFGICTVEIMVRLRQGLVPQEFAALDAEIPLEAFLAAGGLLDHGTLVGDVDTGNGHFAGGIHAAAIGSLCLNGGLAALICRYEAIGIHFSHILVGGGPGQSLVGGGIGGDTSHQLHGLLRLQRDRNGVQGDGCDRSANVYEGVMILLGKGLGIAPGRGLDGQVGDPAESAGSNGGHRGGDGDFFQGAGGKGVGADAGHAGGDGDGGEAGAATEEVGGNLGNSGFDRHTGQVGTAFKWAVRTTNLFQAFGNHDRGQSSAVFESAGTQGLQLCG